MTAHMILCYISLGILFLILVTYLVWSIISVIVTLIRKIKDKNKDK